MYIFRKRTLTTNENVIQLPLMYLIARILNDIWNHFYYDFFKYFPVIIIKIDSWNDQKKRSDEQHKLHLHFIAGVRILADAYIIFCICCIFLAKTMVEGAVYCIFYGDYYSTFCITWKDDTVEIQKRLIRSLPNWATNNWLPYADIRLFGNTSL